MAICNQFAPGRSLPVGICETCGYERIQHVKNAEPIEVPKAELAKVNEAMQAERNTYLSLLTEIGKLFGQAAYVDANGLKCEQIQVAVLPGLVRDILAVKGFKTARTTTQYEREHGKLPTEEEQKAFAEGIVKFYTEPTADAPKKENT